MDPTSLRPGDVLPLARRLDLCPEALRLFAELTDGGRRPDTLLLESADVTTKLGKQSILLVDCALRAECRGQTVSFVPLSDVGRDLLPWLEARLAKCGETARDGDRLCVTYPAPAPLQSEEARLAAPSPMDALRQLALSWRLVSRPAATPLLCAGVLSYDLVDCFERLPAAGADPLGYPDFQFWLPQTLVVINQVKREATILALVYGGEHAVESHNDAGATIARLTEACERAASPAPADLPPPASAGHAVPGQGAESNNITAGVGADLSDDVSVDVSDDDYAAIVTDLKTRIVAGDVFQIVPSRTFSEPCSDPFAAYTELRALNPSPYMYYVAAPDQVLFGASPETCVKVSGTPRQVEIRPIAGTRPRGKTAAGAIDEDLDSRLEAELRLNEKEVAEHVMLVDLARNDIARVAVPGSRRVARLLDVDRYSEVMHLMTAVTGELRTELDAIHAYTASMNMGTLVGAPTLEAAEILRRVEPTKRGPYGGAVGYITADGEMDTAIIIRSAVVSAGVAHVRAGAGVVYDSEPQAEAQETRHKARAVLRALARVKKGEP